MTKKTNHLSLPFSWNPSYDEPPEEPLQRHHCVEPAEDSGSNGGDVYKVGSELGWM